MHDTATRDSHLIRSPVGQSWSSGEDETRGAVKGSFPMDGEYGTYEYLSWAVKFAVDANVKELGVRSKANDDELSVEGDAVDASGNRNRN